MSSTLGVFQGFEITLIALSKVIVDAIIRE